LNNPFIQGWLDSLCGVYSIVNAATLINSLSQEDSQKTFNEVIFFLGRRKILDRVIVEGINHKNLYSVIHGACRSLFPYMETNKKGFLTLNQWWRYSKTFLDEKDKRAIILSLGGKHEHLTVIKKMTSRSMLLVDSGGMIKLLKSNCRLPDYKGIDKHIIYYSQCWYLGVE
jgi:hypothetical protein